MKSKYFIIFYFRSVVFKGDLNSKSNCKYYLHHIEISVIGNKIFVVNKKSLSKLLDRDFCNCLLISMLQSVYVQ